MSIHPVLASGLEAYARGDFAGALRAWEEPWKGLDPEKDPAQRDLSLALVRLTAALHHEKAGRHESSRELYASSRELLADLPDPLLGLDVAALRRSFPPTIAAALEDPPVLQGAHRRLPRRVVVRFLLLVAVVGAGFAALRWTPLAAYLEPEALTGLLTRLRQAWWSPLVLLGLYTVLSPLGLPATPLILAGGFVFGTGLGGFYNILGTFLGTAASFYLGHHLGRDFIVHLAGERLRRMETLLARQSFWNLVRIRFIPIPFPVVNYGAALAGIPASKFLGASAVGLAPAVFIYTWFASALARAAGGDRGAVLLRLGMALGAVLVLTLLPPLARGWARRRRYRQILEHRRGRGVSP